MSKPIQIWFEICALCVGVKLLSATTTFAADTIEWRTNLVSADIRDGNLPWLLEQITSATGWQVYVEPDVSRVVSAKFENLPPGEALRLLLGDLNFALIPQANAKPKLFVSQTTLRNATQRVAVSNSAGSEHPGVNARGHGQRREHPDRPGASNRASNTGPAGD